MHLEPILNLHLCQHIGQLRAAPVQLGTDAPSAFLVAYSADFDVDPYQEMFFIPTDTLKIALWTTAGERLWEKDLGRGVMPGMWFVPVLPFDLDGDGQDEIYFVNNTNPQHPLSINGLVLERLDARTGETTGQWKWPYHRPKETVSHAYRFFLMGGYVHGQPRIITGSGTYSAMKLCGFNASMEQQWEHDIAPETPGARGSHMCPVLDMDGDGVDELLWGERRIELQNGTLLWCADEKEYNGHSDVIQPVWDRTSNRWFVYTCRENDPDASPRVALFNDRGERVWGTVDHGHMDMGWSARLGENGEQHAMSIRIGKKTCGPDGRFHTQCDEFLWNTLTGEPLELTASVYGTIPVDLNGDGTHELVRGTPGLDGAVFDHRGRELGSVGGSVALAQKFCDLPGEQLLVYKPEGALEIWADRNAEESSELLWRVNHPFYRLNRKFMSTGSNLSVLGGL